MKDTLVRIIAIIIVLAMTYFFITAYTNKIEKINNGEITQVSESYMDR